VIIPGFLLNQRSRLKSKTPGSGRRGVVIIYFKGSRGEMYFKDLNSQKIQTFIVTYRLYFIVIGNT
jgi:hypothetical protein